MFSTSAARKLFICYGFLLIFISQTIQVEIDRDELCRTMCSAEPNDEAMKLLDHLRHQGRELDLIQEGLFNNSNQLSIIVKSLGLMGNETQATKLMRTVLRPRSREKHHAIYSRKNKLENVGNSWSNTPSPQRGNAIRILPTSCEEVRLSLSNYFIGRYFTLMKLDKSSDDAFFAGCELRDDAGWIIIQRRVDGFTSFDRSWADYTNGFGTPEGNYWMGNEKIHAITARRPHKLRIELETGSGRKFHSEYGYFRVSSELENFRLMISGYRGGSAGDSLTGMLSHNGSNFSTKDRDNDKYDAGSCARQYQGGWWFHSCFVGFLNGVLSTTPPTPTPVQPSYNSRNSHRWIGRRVRSFYVPAFRQEGIIWRTINSRQTRDLNYYKDNAVKKSTMMITPW